MENRDQGVPTGQGAAGQGAPASAGPLPAKAVTPVLVGLGATAAVAIVAAIWGWSKVGTVEHRAAGLDGQVSQLQGQLSQSQGQSSAFQGQVAELEKRLMDVTAQRDALVPVAARAEALARDRRELLDERNLVVQRLGSASWGRDEASGRASGLEVRLAKLTQERDALAPLVDRVASLTQDRADLLGERNALVQRIGSIGWMRDTAEKRVADLEAQLKHATSRYAELEAEIGGRDALSQDAERLKGEVDAAERRVADLNQALELATRNLAVVGEEIALRSSTLANLRRQQEEARTVLAEAQRQLIQVRDQAGSQAETLQSITK
jgi:chromosome segregation ATPase